MTAPKNAREILIEWLQRHDYDGLCGDCCGCTVDDFMPCGSDPSDCVPAYDHGPGMGAEGHCDHLMMPTKRGRA